MGDRMTPLKLVLSEVVPAETVIDDGCCVRCFNTGTEVVHDLFERPVGARPCDHIVKGESNGNNERQIGGA